MTDKEVIINGIDVSKCVFNYSEICCEIDDEYCFKDNNCYYKQLKRKEQECEELQEKIKKYSKINEQDTKDFAKYKQALDEIEKQVETLLNRTPLFESEQIAEDIIKIQNIIKKAK